MDENTRTVVDFLLGMAGGSLLGLVILWFVLNRMFRRWW